MTKEIKEATIGEYIVAEDLLNTPIKLRIMTVKFLKDEIESPSTGKMLDKVVFTFENGKGESKEIGVLAFDGLVRQMNAVDPDIGDVLQLETIQVGNAKYLTWKVDIVADTMKKVKKQEKDVAEDDSDEKIKIEDIPF